MICSRRQRYPLYDCRVHPHLLALRSCCMTSPRWLATLGRKLQSLGLSLESRDRSPSRRRPARRPRPLRLEALEERTLLAAAVTIDGADALAFQSNTTSTVHVSFSGGVYT